MTELARLIIVTGPTASGKSTLGIELAREFHGEIVSADSRQVYRGLDIGTGKVTPAERESVPHHLLDVAEPTTIYTVAQFQQAAINAIDEIVARDNQPFLVGGSPHYIQSVVDHLDIPPVPPQPALRTSLEARPLAELLAELTRLDPDCAAVIDRQNPRRIIRALEVCLTTGRPFSAQRGTASPLYRPLLLAIAWPRAELYARIDRRVDTRMQEGMVEEVRQLVHAGLSPERLEALGLEYRFIGRFLRGDFTSEAEMVERLKFAIHDFTRRQLTWLRKDQRIIWVDGQRLTTAFALVGEFLQT